MNDIEAEIIRIAARELSLADTDIGLDEDYLDLGADSLDWFDVALGVEEWFCVDIPDDMVPKLRTVREMAAYVQKRIER